jgi:hypothetical protein
MSAAAPALVDYPPSQLSRLRLYNLIVGLIHLVQAAFIFSRGNDFTLPINLTIIPGPPGTAPQAPDTVWNFPLGPAVAIFLLFAAVDHLLMAAPGVNAWYNMNLRRKENRARWIEYSISSSLMIVLIAIVTGIMNLTALVAIFGANTMMILFGILQERISRPGEGKTYWWPYIFGCLAGLVPWLAIAIQVVHTEKTAADGGIPGFVYGIIVSIFLFFNTFSINMVLQYKQVGRWKSYLFGESAYIFFSLVAKALLAWQIYANTLIPPDAAEAGRWLIGRF